MVNDCAKRCEAKNVFTGKRNFFLNKAKKEKKTFLWKPFDQCRRLKVRERQEMFFVMSLRLSDHEVLHNIASSLRFFSISLGVSRFFRSYFVLQIFEV